jgi:hypothetical protein
MDLEHLTKHQIVLLTLLVSFVTSIATGIVTVSLMNQAPPEVSRTINQIVERTVEKVAPQTNASAALASTVTQKTVVVKDDDLASQSIAAMQKALVRIVDTTDPDKLVSRGVIVAADGTTVTDRAALIASGAKSFEAILYSGERVAVSIRSSDATTSLAVLDLAMGTSTGFAPASVADVSKLRLGQNVIRIGGGGADTVGTGRDCEPDGLSWESHRGQRTISNTWIRTHDALRRSNRHHHGRLIRRRKHLI